MIQSKPVIDAVERMSAGVGNALLPKVITQIVDVLAETLNFLELGFGDAPGQHVDLASVFWKVGRNFVADEHTFEMGYFQGASNAVVVGDRNELHSPTPSPFVNRFGFGVALGRSNPPQDPF